MIKISSYSGIIGVSRLKNSGFKAFLSLGNILLRKGKIAPALASYQRAFKPLFINDFQRGWKENQNPEAEFIVNTKYNFVYCPIGKIASSSLKRIMVELSDLENKEEILNLPKGFIHAYLEQTLALCCNYNYQEGMKLLEDERYFKFVIVRNPWDRLASGYLNKFVVARNLQGSLFPPPKYVKNPIDNVYRSKRLEPDYQKSISFKEFVKYVSLTEDRKLDGHWRPQYLHLGNTKFDFIGKLEKLDEDFKYIKEKLNLDVDLPWSNKTKRKNNNSNYTQKKQGDRHYCDLYPLELKQLKNYPKSDEIYTPDLIKLVAQRYKKDIEMFDYDRPLIVTSNQ